jgi:hypothetical protein
VVGSDAGVKGPGAAAEAHLGQEEAQKDTADYDPAADDKLTEKI